MDGTDGPPAQVSQMGPTLIREGTAEEELVLDAPRLHRAGHPTSDGHYQRARHF